MQQKYFIHEPAIDIPVKMISDILVVGGGPSGIMAAQAASEDGLDVVLVENRSFLGGNLTFGLPILGFHSQKGIQIIKGLPQKFVERLQARNAASKIQLCPLHMSIAFLEPEAVKTAAIELLRDNNVNILLHTFCTGAVMEGNTVKGIIVESKAGREAILAQTVIDCSGDADVAFRAGVPCTMGDEAGRVQSATLEFSMENVDVDKLRLSVANESHTYTPDFISPEYYQENRFFILVGLRDIVRKARERGLQLPVDKVVIVTGLRKGEMWINMNRANGIDGTDPVSLTQGEIITRRQLKELSDYFITYVPGFENAYLSRTAPALGIRETRRIVGKYILTKDDIMARRRFEDEIAVASYPIDIHHPVGGGFSLEWSGDCYDIPYRALVPEKVENILVAGRCIPSTHEALASVRVMAPCMAMGEAAGRAAKIAVRDGIPPSDIDVKKLRNELILTGAYLRP